MLANLIPLYLYQGYPLPPPQHLYDYLLAEQGLIKRIETWHVSADMLLAPIEAALIGLHLKPYPFQGLRLKLPRIPGPLLAGVLADARRQPELEVMYQVRFETDRGWQVTRPEQAQARYRVGYHDPNPATVVLELHSHGRMGAYFSPTDDADEQGGRFYGVLGHVDRAEPELALRLGMYGTWLANVPGLSLFEALGSLVEVYGRPEAELNHTRGAGQSWFAELLNWRSS